VATRAVILLLFVVHMTFFSANLLKLSKGWGALLFGLAMG